MYGPKAISVVVWTAEDSQNGLIFKCLIVVKKSYHVECFEFLQCPDFSESSNLQQDSMLVKKLEEEIKHLKAQLESNIKDLSRK